MSVDRPNLYDILLGVPEDAAREVRVIVHQGVQSDFQELTEKIELIARKYSLPIEQINLYYSYVFFENFDAVTLAYSTDPEDPSRVEINIALYAGDIPGTTTVMQISKKFVKYTSVMMRSEDFDRFKLQMRLLLLAMGFNDLTLEDVMQRGIVYKS